MSAQQKLSPFEIAVQKEERALAERRMLIINVLPEKEQNAMSVGDIQKKVPALNGGTPGTLVALSIDDLITKGAVKRSTRHSEPRFFRTRH